MRRISADSGTLEVIGGEDSDAVNNCSSVPEVSPRVEAAGPGGRDARIENRTPQGVPTSTGERFDEFPCPGVLSPNLVDFPITYN